jgi:hypothetical protein
MFCVLVVVRKKRFLGKRHQIGLGHHTVRIVVNDPAATLAVLPVERLFEPDEFFFGQLRQRSLNFGNRAHIWTVMTGMRSVNR